MVAERIPRIENHEVEPRQKPSNKTAYLIESSATVPIHAALELRVPPMPPHAEVAQCICFDDMGHAG